VVNCWCIRNHNKFQKFDISFKTVWILAFDHIVFGYLDANSMFYCGQIHVDAVTMESWIDQWASRIIFSATTNELFMTHYRNVPLDTYSLILSFILEQITKINQSAYHGNMNWRISFKQLQLGPSWNLTEICLLILW